MLDESKLSGIRLFGYSFLILFFELALIRYIPANIQIASYFINLVLIAAFLGMGAGLIFQLRGREITHLFLPALLVLVLLCHYLSGIIVKAPVSSTEYLWSIQSSPSPTAQRLGMIPAISLLFIFSSIVFIPLGSAVGREFKNFAPLVAYSINILGSLAGIGLFALLSFFSTAPMFWFATGMVFFLCLSIKKRPALSIKKRSVLIFSICFPLILFILSVNSPTKGEIWSPYYKINYFDEDRLTSLIVNGSFHQYIVDFREEGLEPGSYIDLTRKDYLRPYQFVKNPEEVLVLGAGGGNDIAIALQQNAGHIDAVEIDREIFKLGKKLHRQKPYQDPRVDVYIDDARAFLKKSKKKYDLIVMGTLDSQTLLSGLSSVRLDNYVYTLEAFQSIKSHLKPGGILILYHMSPSQLISYKIFAMLKKVFGHSPLVNFQRNHRLFNYTFVTGAVNKISPDFKLEFLISTPEGEKGLEKSHPVPTDNWPYLYLDRPGIPDFYIKVGAVIIAFSLLLVGLVLGKKNIGSPDRPLFFLGAGFLLLETKSVTEMSLLFGSTWQVNLLVFSSILLLVLAANLIVLKTASLKIDSIFILLFGTIGLCYIFPVQKLLDLPLVGQWVAGGLLVALPLFFAGLTFAILFKNRKRPVKSLGYNLIGAIMGGLLEYSAMAMGTKSLYLVSVLMYLLAYMTHRTGKGLAV